jgi:3-oxoadipate enol-lactonase
VAVEHFAVRGIRLCANVTGDPGARPLVLIHALGLDKSSWDDIAPAFAVSHRVYAVDMRGFGDSERPGQYSYEDMRDDVLALFDVIGADTVDLIGHSMGGGVAWLVAEAQPARLAHLVVEDTPPMRSGARPFRIPPDEPPEDVPFDWTALLALTAQFQDPDPAWWDEIPAVTAPVLMLAGGPGSHVPQQWFDQALPLMRDARLQEIPVGHHIHAEAPDRFLAAVTPFLAT